VRGGREENREGRGTGEEAREREVTEDSRGRVSRRQCNAVNKGNNNGGKGREERKKKKLTSLKAEMTG
jgi:hypothetical protein